MDPRSERCIYVVSKNQPQKTRKAGLLSSPFVHVHNVMLWSAT